MGEQANQVTWTGVKQAARTVRGCLSLALPVLALTLALGAVVVRLMGGARLDGLMILGAAGAAALLVIDLLLRPVAAAELSAALADAPMRQLLDSAGPMVMGVGLDGRFTYLNPAAERMLGYNAPELKQMSNAGEILAPGQGERLMQEMLRLRAGAKLPNLESSDQLAAYMESVSSLPPSLVPCFEAQLCRKDGALIPVTLHISAVRNSTGAFTGLVAVALDQSAVLKQDLALRESQERYRDLFENSSEMIATLSPGGQFLYANPAWKRCFGRDNATLVQLESFDEVFGLNSRSQVAALFRRALDGETVDRAPVRNQTLDGRVLELELSLSQRQKAGNPLAVRCLLRDVTQQKQREHRLALQLVVSQIVGENTSADVAAMRILEALCSSQGWDVALKWDVNMDENRLEFSTAWGVPARRTEALIQESMGLTMNRGDDLPGRVWRDGRPVWITDLESMPPNRRIQSARKHEMLSGWAVPVRVGNTVLAVLEFYCHFRLKEDRESMAAMETAATSLGQMLARTRERGRAEELYRQREILLDSVADGICGVDRRGAVSFANPAAARLLGTVASNLTGKVVHELLHGPAVEGRSCGEDCPLRRATGHQMPVTGEDTIYRADGSSFPAEYALTPILDQGRFSGSVLSFRDISQRYALDRLKDEFISTVSHELRTPLTSIRGALGLLSSGILGEVNDKAANLLRIALTNSDRLVRLINDILDLERIQSGREPLTFRPVRLAEIVRQAIDGMQPVAEAAGVQLIHDTTQVEIAADPDRLLQVLTNLLSNAIKFSPPNSTISVMLRPGVSGVTLSVIDHGRGIPADKLEAIFGRFQQVDASDSRQKGGSGLGLAICRTIVLQHSGRIWAERNPVRGSTFRVFLPYQPTATAAAPAKFDHEQKHEQGQGTVLLADSNSATRPALAAKLSRHGYKVVETGNVEQTLAAAHAGVQAILLDTALDGMNGWEILPLLRQLNPEARTPVVLLSVANAKSPADWPGEAEGLVTSPVEEDALLSELARVLSVRGEKARILVVEDDVDLAEVIGTMFSRDGIEVEVAHTRQEALDACFAFQPNLLVLDIGLPDGDGFNVVDWLRQHESLAGLPLVVYSGRQLSAAERRQLTLGPTHFLSKARVEPQQLEALVLTMLRSSRRMEEIPFSAQAAWER
jgi:PAS domain S-box-containing protein